MIINEYIATIHVPVGVTTYCRNCNENYSSVVNIPIEGESSMTIDGSKEMAVALSPLILDQIKIGRYILDPLPCPKCSEIPKWLKLGESIQNKRNTLRAIIHIFLLIVLFIASLLICIKINVGELSIIISAGVSISINLSIKRFIKFITDNTMFGYNFINECEKSGDPKPIIEILQP